MPKNTYKKNVESLSLWWNHTGLYNRGQWIFMEWVNSFSKEMSVPIRKYKFTGRQSYKEKLKKKNGIDTGLPAEFPWEIKKWLFKKIWAQK